MDTMTISEQLEASMALAYDDSIKNFYVSAFIELHAGVSRAIPEIKAMEERLARLETAAQASRFPEHEYAVYDDGRECRCGRKDCADANLNAALAPEHADWSRIPVDASPYLRSVVEQIHRDTHDALEAVPVEESRTPVETALREQVASLTAAIEDTLDRIWRNPRLGRRWSCRLCNDRSFDTGPHHGECELWPLIEAVARIKSVEAAVTGVQA